MARGELMKRLLASYGRDDEFRAVAEQIIDEEEKKNNRVLARSLRMTLDGGPSRPSRPRALAPLIPFPEAAGDYIEFVEHSHTKQDIVLSAENVKVFIGLLKEFRRAEEIRRRGLQTRSKLLFCGPPGCGKTLCAEIFAAELGLPLYIVKLDRLISSYVGETATNVRESVNSPASSRAKCSSTSSTRWHARGTTAASTTNSVAWSIACLSLSSRITPKGFLVAATVATKHSTALCGAGLTR